MFNATVIADSVGPNGVRITSVQMTYPRFVHSELMTHRSFARNAASSRAIPWKKLKEDGSLHEKCMLAMLSNDPVVPIVFGKEQKGMQTGDALAGDDLYDAQQTWLMARDQAIFAAEKLARLGVHKSICNRLTEPWMWITTLVTGTEWNNFFRLRCHKDAEIHFQKIAGMVRDEINQSIPTCPIAGEWHTPYLPPSEYPSLELALSKRELVTVNAEDYMMFTRDREGEADKIFWKYAKRISAGRAARISYLTQDGKRDFDEDIRLFQRLIERDDDVLHASPLEHVCEASSRIDLVSGCMRGWKTFRSEFQNENVSGHLEVMGTTTEEVAG